MPSPPEIPRRSAPIAIIGMACRLPGGVTSPDAFWNLLANSRDAVSTIPPDRWLADRFYAPDPLQPGKYPTRDGGFLAGVDLFDAGFFGISPREAARMDPQQRLLLETAWEALEDAAHPVDRRRPSPTGVFVGVSSVDYNNVQEMLDELDEVDAHAATGTSYSIVANRISHALNFTGPSLAIDTACSSSLVALHVACRSLEDGECDRALVGGVNIILDPKTYVAFSRLSMLAPDGRCRAFDAAGSGFARAEGIGVVVLERLDRALAAGDPIRAVIRGTGVNQDGHTPGITMPNEQAQTDLVRQVCARAGIDPHDVSYVESHGPGTPVGDPIEARSLSAALCAGRARGDALVVGSVKTNIGHLEPAAGVTGVIKLALMFGRREIPANLHFVRPNPAIDLDGLGLRIPVALEPWPARRPMIGGVDSFGFGGTNAHAVLEAAPPARDPRPAESGVALRPAVVCLSAHTEGSLSRFAAACRAEALSGKWVGTSVHDIAWTSATRRIHHGHRLGVVAATLEELADRLGTFCRGETGEGILRGRVSPDAPPSIAFVFSGQGPQWWAMGRELLETESVFRDAIIECDRLLRPRAGWSLVEELTASASDSRMGLPAVAQPAIFCLQVALTRLWASWGIRPDAAVGHSVGEVAAAWVGGILSLEDALRVIVHRGRCMQLVPATGRMLAAALDPDAARTTIAHHAGRATIAAINSPESVTLSGDADAIADIERMLQDAGVHCRSLAVEYAFHSHHVDGIRDDVRGALAGLPTAASQVPVYSTVSGQPAAAGDFGPDYWWRNVREPVRFSEAVAGLIAGGCTVFLEMGPHPVLSGPITECLLHAGRRASVLHSLRRGRPERAEMLSALAALHTQGCEVSWTALHPGAGAVVPFPPYAWEHQSYWHQTDACREFLRGSPDGPLLGRRLPTPVPAWESRLSVQTVAFLRDHRVHGNLVFPATGTIELALAAAAACGIDVPAVENLRLHAPVFLSPDHDVVVHTRFDPGDSSCAIHWRPSTGARSWQLHSTCTVVPATAPPRDAIESLAAALPRRPGSPSQRFSGDGAADGFYPALRECGFDYGPAFRAVTRLFDGDGEWLGEIVPSREVLDDLDRHRFHPAALDACLQVMARAAPLESGATYLPVGLRRARLFRRPAPRMWSHVHDVRTVGASTFGSLTILADDGTLVADVEEFEARTLAERATRDVSSVEPLLYTYRWIHDVRRRPHAGPSDATGWWVLVGGKGAVGRCLAARLEQRGGRVLLADMADPLPASLLHGEVLSTCRGIVHLAALECPSTEALCELDLRERLPALDMSLVRIAQTLMEHGGAAVPRVWVVTRGAAAGPGLPAGEVAVMSASLWGLGRVVANEYPRARCTLVDIGAREREDDDGEADDLLRELLGADDEDEIALRDSHRYVHRYGRTSLGAAWAEVAGRAGTDPGRSMFRLECRPAGVLDHLRLREAARRPPGRGEVEVEVKAVGLNFKDVMHALALLPGVIDGSPPFGLECSGVVSRVGPEVSDFEPGDRVLAFGTHCAASHVVIGQHRVAAMPAGLSFEAAATIPAVFVTACFALVHEAKLRQGERVLIHSASGGVGLAAIQVARRIGADVLATAGTPEKRAFLEGLGIQHVFDSRSLDFADRVMAVTNGEGVDVVLNSLAGEAVPKGLSVLRNKGRFVELGVREMMQDRRLPMSLFRNNLSFYFVDFARVERDRPSLITRILRDIAVSVEAGAYRPLPFTAFPAARVQDGFRLMAQARHTGKIVFTFDDPALPVSLPAEADVRLRPDGAYLITGGLGGFGLAVARWMAAHGARHLVLAGRSGASAAGAREIVDDIRALGTTVIVEQADVTCEAGVVAMLAAADRATHPLRGIVHAAMVLDDCLLQDLSIERLARVLMPKALGAWHLDRLTRHVALDFFVMFSSCSSMLGLPGQANYDAANAVLDALAWHRRWRGEPATTINWGFLGQVGWAAARQHVVDRFETIGVSGIDPPTALSALGQVLGRNATQVSVIGIDWPTFFEHAPTCRTSPRFSALARAAGDGGIGGSAARTANSPRVWRTEDPVAGVAAIEAALREQVALVCGASLASVDAATSLADLGFDSLMAVELRNWVESSLRVPLRTMDIMRGPTLHQLATGLFGALRRAGGPPA